jgi:hypothetical protein
MAISMGLYMRLERLGGEQDGKSQGYNVTTGYHIL